MMDPPAGQRFLTLDGQEPGAANALQPLPDKWRLEPDAPELGELRLSEAQRSLIRDAVASTALEPLAFTLDQARNNTSLVLLLTFGGRSLLFAGDAQYGSWRWWLDREDSAAILGRLSFLKVSHHGSFNGLPRDALNRMTGGELAAMVSTQNVPWASIPRLPLLERLAEVTAGRLVRSDSLALVDHPDAPQGPALGELPVGFKRGELWWDYSLMV
jgi:hypothetical protein